MKKITIETPLEIYDTIEALPVLIQNLFTKAQTARNNAYAPYSHFKVGAALLLENGTTVAGNNQENAAYPSGLCAERVAIFHAGATHPNKVVQALAITVKAADKTVNTPVAPCGACRQALLEYEIKQDAPIAIYFRGETGPIYKVPSVASILPLAFDKSFL
jgi:cytidine deaminase